jgi:hypothetical protein
MTMAKNLKASSKTTSSVASESSNIQTAQSTKANGRMAKDMAKAPATLQTATSFTRAS